MSTTVIPNLGECCQLTTVTLPGTGVLLNRGTPYWLVASADDVNGPSFKGGWQLSHLAENAFLNPPLPWRAGVPGIVLPGAEGSTTDIPDAGECCDLTQVTLPGRGVALIAGTKYWLVASPDNDNAPTFSGFWQRTGLAVDAFKYPEQLGNWTTGSGDWLAAEIRGSNR